MSAKVLLTILAAGLMAAQAPAPRVIPNDPYFKYQVSFLNPGGKTHDRADFDQALAGQTSKRRRASTRTSPGPGRSRPGSRQVVVAVLDDGFFYDHEDLAGNIWANPGRVGPGRHRPCQGDQRHRRRQERLCRRRHGLGFRLRRSRPRLLRLRRQAAGTASSRTGTASRPWASSGRGGTTASAWPGSTGTSR